MTFVALEAGLKIDDFWWLSGGAEAEASWSGDGDVACPRSPFHQPNSLPDLMQDTKSNIRTARMKG